MWRLDDYCEVQTRFTSSTANTYDLPRGALILNVAASTLDEAIERLNILIKTRLVPKLGPAGHVFSMVAPKGSHRFRINWWPTSLERNRHTCWSCNGQRYHTHFHSCSACGRTGRNYETRDETVEVDVDCSPCGGGGRTCRSEENGYGGYACFTCGGSGKVKGWRTESRQYDIGPCGACDGRGSWTTTSDCGPCGASGTILERYHREHQVLLHHQKAQADHDEHIRSEMADINKGLKKEVIARNYAIGALVLLLIPLLYKILFLR